MPVHAIHRGNDRQRIFHSDSDFLFFRGCLDRVRRKEQVDIHAYVLMSNHVHLVMTPRVEDALSRFMQCVAVRYVQYFNKRYSRSGTLWEGRFHATCLPNERYLLACHRYVDLNPVRAGLVRLPGQYRWSSHRYYAWGDNDALLTPHSLAAPLRGAQYLELFDSPGDSSLLAAIREASQHGLPLGQHGVVRPARGRPRQKSVSDTDLDVLVQEIRV